MEYDPGITQVVVEVVTQLSAGTPAWPPPPVWPVMGSPGRLDGICSSTLWGEAYEGQSAGIFTLFTICKVQQNRNK
jgi:hypothetical protein